MGWSELPPCFCMCTEMVADVTNQQVAVYQAAPVWLHPQELQADCNPWALASMGMPMAQWSMPSMHQQPFPVAQAEVYLNDFISLVQMAANETKVQHHMMNNINDMFCANGPQEKHKKPISDRLPVMQPGQHSSPSWAGR